MKIGAINIFSPSFSGKIIDSHVHSGEFGRRNYPASKLDTFVKSPLKVKVQGEEQEDTVDKMLISNLSAMNGRQALNETEGNLEILEVCANNDKLLPLAVCEPDKTNGDTSAIRELLDGGDFKGLKFHPEGNPLRADDEAYDSYLDLAEEFDLPCVFHSQVNLNWTEDENGKWNAELVTDPEKLSNSDPEFIYTLAKRHKKVPVIMAHTGAGGALAHKKAISVMEESLKNDDAKLYCDISWIDFKDGLPDKKSESLVNLISVAIENDAEDRILFGTDSPLGCFGEAPSGGLTPKEAYEETVGVFKTVIRDNFPEKGDELIDKIFYKNAQKLFLKEEE